MKKRIFAAVLALALCLAALSVPALAHGCHRARRSAASRAAVSVSCYVDADQDGVCDNCHRVCHRGVCGSGAAAVRYGRGCGCGRCCHHH